MIDYAEGSGRHYHIGVRPDEIGEIRDPAGRPEAVREYRGLFG